MQRRKFVSTALAATALPLGCAAANKIQGKNLDSEKELYEIRVYDMKFGVNAKPIVDYLKNVLQPTMLKAGANHCMIFNEISGELPRKIWVLISYPTALTYINAQNLSGNENYQAASETYNQLKNIAFNRYESWLLHAFDGFPKLEKPMDKDSIFEIRTYESINEDALRRKIKMFNKEEVPIFKDAGLPPIFFGEMLAGPYRPALTYMIHCKDMEASRAGWQAFLQHPDWKRIFVLPEYAKTVSNIRNVFLKLI